MPHIVRRDMELRHKQGKDVEVMRRVTANEPADALVPGYRIKKALEVAKGHGVDGGHALSVVCGELENGKEIAGAGFFSSVDDVSFSPEGIVDMQKRAKDGNAMPFNFGGIVKYDAIFVDHVFEYLEGGNKQLFMDQISQALKGGGLLVLSFPTTLPASFVEDRLEYRDLLRTMPLVHLFEEHENQNAESLQFESGMISALKGSGWEVLEAIDYRSERNFVEVQMAFVVLKKP